MIHALPSAATDALADHYDPDEVWLFGSRAAGTAEEESDWDVLLLLPSDADKARQSAILGNDILERAGIRGDVRHVSSDVFHSSSGVPNSLRRVIGEDIVLCYRREGFAPQIMSEDAATGRFVSDLRNEAEEYLAAAAVLSGRHYGQINLLRFACRNILVALLTRAGIHAGRDAFGPQGISVLLELLPRELHSPNLTSGIGLLEKLDGFDLTEIHEFVAQPPAEDTDILDGLQTALEELMQRL
jgi:predicted nucleotidyltransferase